MIDEELAKRFLDGEVLAGPQVTQIMGMLYGGGAWRIYATVAAAELREGNTQRALELLQTLLEAQEEKEAVDDEH